MLRCYRPCSSTSHDQTRRQVCSLVSAGLTTRSSAVWPSQEFRLAARRVRHVLGLTTPGVLGGFRRISRNGTLKTDLSARTRIPVRRSVRPNGVYRDPCPVVLRGSFATASRAPAPSPMRETRVFTTRDERRTYTRRWVRRRNQSSGDTVWCCPAASLGCATSYRRPILPRSRHRPLA